MSDPGNRWRVRRLRGRRPVPCPWLVERWHWGMWQTIGARPTQAEAFAWADARARHRPFDYALAQ